MKAFLDTSVLVPLFLAGHEHHSASLKLFPRLERRQSFCATHSLAELFATMIRLPGTHRVSGEHAMLFLAEIRKRLNFVSLDAQQCYLTIERADGDDSAGGTICDALVAGCAFQCQGGHVVYLEGEALPAIRFSGSNQGS